MEINYREIRDGEASSFSGAGQSARCVIPPIRRWFHEPSAKEAILTLMKNLVLSINITGVKKGDGKPNS
jgi:hypothetical protein